MQGCGICDTRLIEGFIAWDSRRCQPEEKEARQEINSMPISLENETNISSHGTWPELTHAYSHEINTDAFRALEATFTRYRMARKAKAR